MELGSTEENVIVSDPSHCILWMQDKKILGHVLWHDCSTSEHRKGDPRDKMDSEILEAIFGRKEHLIELHEVWLKKPFRGRGYGKEFFEFFEDFIFKKGFHDIVYYADHPAALTICRKRGYKEAFYKEYRWYVFGKSID